MPFFSIVIPTYNRLEMLKETLASLDTQTEKDFEIIVIDDGSTDGTPEYLQTLNSEITVISLINSGPGAARNAGIQAAKGEYISFLDSDDLFFPWSLATYKKSIQSTSSKILFGKPAEFNQPEELLSIAPSTIQSETFDDYYSSGDQWRWWGVSSFIIKRPLLNDVKFLTESINAEDADLLMKLGTQGPLTQITSPCTFAYRQHDGSIMGNWNKSWGGIQKLIENEIKDLYPGGRERKAQRLTILLRHIKPELLAALKTGKKREAMSTFQRIFPWFLKLKQGKFILGYIFHYLKPTR